MSYEPDLRLGPTIRRGQSEQSVGTPPEFLDAVQRSFGRITFDLAASSGNAVVDRFYGIEHDSLAQDWERITGGGLLWLNPPYANIAPWAKKCALSRRAIALLVPASIDANWYWEWCHPFADTFILHPRLKFIGHKDPFPKGLMLCLFGQRGGATITRWHWQKERAL